MKATKGLGVVVLAAACLALTGCTDNTGAIDQLGHNGFDRMACTDYATMANEVRHDAMTVPQAAGVAQKIAENSQRGGDPNVRQAGTDLANAYRMNSTAMLTQAMTKFRNACTWSGA